MSFSVQLTKRAYKDYKKLPNIVQDKASDVIDQLQGNPFILDIQKLKTPFEGYRVRFGDYRLLFTIKKKVVTIYSIKNRKDAYK